MSRTIRRNNKHQIDRYLGTREELERKAENRIGRYPDSLSFEQTYQRDRARYTRDRHSGIHGKSNYFRRLTGVWAIRCREKQALHNHHRNDTWEAHLPENRPGRQTRHYTYC